MRVTCPTCDAHYEIAESMLPAPGRHVQCSACHTRWFVRSEAPKAQESEDDIVRRLEARSHLRAVPSPLPPVLAETVKPEVAEEPEPELEEGEAETEPASDPGTVGAGPASEPAAVVPPPPPPPPSAAPAKPAERPMVRSEGVALRPAPRIDLGRETMSPVPEPAPARGGGAGRWLLVILVLLAVAAGIYVWRGPLAASVPAAAPALGAYGRAIDDLRLKLGDAFPG